MRYAILPIRVGVRLQKLPACMKFVGEVRLVLIESRGIPLLPAALTRHLEILRRISLHC